MNTDLLEVKRELLEKLLTQIEILKLVANQIESLQTQLNELNERIINIENKPQTII